MTTPNWTARPAPLLARRLAIRWGAIALAAIIAVSAILWPDRYGASVLTLFLVNSFVILGLILVMGFTGQLSVGHIALFAIGAYAYAITTTKLEWPTIPAAVFAALVAGAAGFLLGLPTLRLRKFYFALATLGLAMVTPQLLIEWGDLTGGGSGIAAIPPIVPRDWFVVALGILFLASVAAISWLVSTPWGKSLTAIRQSEPIAAVLGIPTVRTKLYAFALSGVVAGLGGVLYASYITYISPDGFGVEQSLYFFVVLILGGFSSVFFPIVALLGMTLIMQALSVYPTISGLSYGVLLVLVSTLFPGGLASLFTVRRLRRREATVDPAEFAELGLSADGASALGLRPAGEGGDVVLRVHSVHKSFGGVRALRDVSVEVARGGIHAIIGPNGSGKTTLLNAVSGTYMIDSGDITINGRPTRGLRSYARARLGLARTFQTPQLVPDLTVQENCELGGAPRFADNLLTASFRPWRQHAVARELRDESERTLTVMGLSAFAAQRASSVPHAVARFVEIARAVVSRADCILMDEPAAGLSDLEIDHLADTVVALRNVGFTIVIVEHHIELVQRIADQITVLDFGEVIATGDPAAVLSDDRVLESYIGKEGAVE